MSDIDIRSRLGWVPDLPDSRDRYFTIQPLELLTLPVSVDLRSKCPPIRDQGNLGSCTGFAIAGVHHIDQIKMGQQDFVPSPLFIYYNERVQEGTVNMDAGAMIRDGIKSIGDLGVCKEPDWPYDIQKFRNEPPQTAYSEAEKHQAIQYARVPQNMNSIRAVLAQGYPIAFGFSVYESFETSEVAHTGMMPMPGSNESLLGGHAVVIVGYDDTTQRVTVRNSWSANWGDKGYFYMPYAYVTNPDLCQDFWQVTQVEADVPPPPAPTPTPVFKATKQKVSNRGVPPDSFLAALVAWAKSAPEEIFAVNSAADDVMSLIRPTLGPWESIKHRRAALVETLRVLAGFESSWNWNEGPDTSNPSENNPETMSAGAFQCSWNSRSFGQDLKNMAAKNAIADGVKFQSFTKSNHAFAMEWCARLIRKTTHHHGPLKRKEVLPWLKRDAVKEFQQIIFS